MIVAFRLGSHSCHVHSLCSDLYISGIEYYMPHEVFGSRRVYSIYRFCICFILFIVSWDIAHAAFLQLPACKEPSYDGVDAQ